jgi:hypothetical protein
LKSANHRKNVQLSQNGGPGEGNVSKKRKIDDTEEDDGRKKTKPLQSGQASSDLELLAKHAENEAEIAKFKAEMAGKSEVGKGKGLDAEAGEEHADAQVPLDEAVEMPPQQHDPQPAPAVNEDEWVAFEREVARLANDTVQTAPDYSSVFISAPPPWAVEMAAERKAERARGKDLEVEDEREEDENRMAEEFEVMEALEKRVRRLKAMRGNLRIKLARVDEQGRAEGRGEEEPQGVPPSLQEDDEDDEDSDDADDWFS